MIKHEFVYIIYIQYICTRVYLLCIYKYKHMHVYVYILEKFCLFIKYIYLYII